MSLLSIVFPIIGAFVGWLMMRIILRYLFGSVLPPLKPVAAEALARYATLRINIPAMAGKLAGPEAVDSMKPAIEAHLDHLLRVRLEDKIPMISMLMGDKTIDKLKAAAMEELDDALPKVIVQLGEKVTEKYPVETIIKEQVMQQDEKALIAALKKSLRPQLIFLQLLGGLSGFIIGLLMIISLMVIVAMNT